MADHWPPGPLRWPATPLTDGLVICDRPRGLDAPLIARACQDGAAATWLPLPQPYTEGHAHEFIASRQAVADAGDELTFAVRDVARDVVGMVGLHVSRCRHGEAEIGYWTAPWARGRGVASRASQLVVRYAFETLRPARIEFLVAVANVGSQKAARRAGARDEGIRRGGIELHGRRVDAWVGAILPGDLDSE